MLIWFIAIQVLSFVYVYVSTLYFPCNLAFSLKWLSVTHFHDHLHREGFNSFSLPIFTTSSIVKLSAAGLHRVRYFYLSLTVDSSSNFKLRLDLYCTWWSLINKKWLSVSVFFLFHFYGGIPYILGCFRSLPIGIHIFSVALSLLFLGLVS